MHDRARIRRFALLTRPAHARRLRADRAQRVPPLRRHPPDHREPGRPRRALAGGRPLGAHLRRQRELVPRDAASASSRTSSSSASGPAGTTSAALLVHAASACLLLLALARATGRPGPRSPPPPSSRSTPCASSPSPGPPSSRTSSRPSSSSSPSLGHLRARRAPGGTGRRPRRGAAFALALRRSRRPSCSRCSCSCWTLARSAGCAGGSPPARAREAPPLSPLARRRHPTIATQHRAGAVGSIAAYPPDVRVLNAARSAAAYLGKLLFPAALSPFYPHPGRRHRPPRGPPPRALLVPLTVLALRAARSRPWLAAGWAWYLAALPPGGARSRSVPRDGGPLHLPAARRGDPRRRVGARPARRAGAPRRALSPRRPRLVAALALLTRCRSAAGATTGTLFAHALAVAPGDARAPASSPRSPASGASRRRRSRTSSRSSRSSPATSTRGPCSG